MCPRMCHVIRSRTFIISISYKSIQCIWLEESHSHTLFRLDKDKNIHTPPSLGLGFGGSEIIQRLVDVITKWALDDAPWGHRNDTVYPLRTPMLPPMFLHIPATQPDGSRKMEENNGIFVSRVALLLLLLVLVLVLVGGGCGGNGDGNGDDGDDDDAAADDDDDDDDDKDT
ncbi:hypothetical protein M0802_007944 [Mischocyttarus mexicanus]|nr:hypothetical protein M0802_007944 [Mischocyttarus mexicanus]